MFMLPLIDDDVTENHRWNSSLDGRAIHSFLLWIEPHSNARAGLSTNHAMPATQAVCALDRALATLGDTEVFGRLHRLPSDALISVSNGPTLAALSPSPDALGSLEAARRPTQAAIKDALAILQSVGLRYIMDLAVGVIVVSGDPPMPGAAEVCDVAWLSDVGSDRVLLAEALLREGARSWLWQWLQVEETVGMRSGPVSAADLLWLTSLFGDCMAFQLHDRLVRSGAWADDWRTVIHDRLSAQRSELPGRLDRTVGMGVVCELIGFSYPCWNRRQFAVKSPFDYIREIRPLTADERAEHLSRWGAPAAVR